MLQKKVKKRASLLTIFLVVSVIAIFLILNSLNKNILYFKSPTDIKINPRAKKDEKIIPIEVSSPILVFLIINPRNKATNIAAGAPKADMLNPKNTPIAIIGIGYVGFPLAIHFKKNFEKFEGLASKRTIQGGPKIQY